MTIKCSVYCGASLDGFIAGTGGDIEWLHRPEYDDAGVTGLTYDRFIASVDALVMGRHTFEKLLTFETWPYEVPVIVLSTTLKDLPGHTRGKARLMAGPPEEVVQRLARESRRHLYIDGGMTIQRFLGARLIHEITITYLPILLGGGIPLFGSIGVETPLRLLEAVSHKDFVQVRYQVANR
jgi:dihydrofolate reductase